MKRKMIGAALALLMSSGVAMADAAADQDTTPVTKCEGLPPSVSILTMSWSDTTKVCSEMIRVLVGVRYKDITNFEVAITLLQRFGYKGGFVDDNIPRIAKELGEIIRLRGLYDKPDRWYDTNDLIVRAWTGFHGAVGPDQVISNLQAAGPMAKTLSDAGLITLIVMIKDKMGTQSR